MDPCWTWVCRWTACLSPTCGPPLHGMRRLPDHHDGTPPHVCQHLQARCLNPHPLAHRASAAVGQRPRWSRRIWVILRSGPWHTSQQLLGRFFVLSPSGDDPYIALIRESYARSLPPSVKTPCPAQDQEHPHGTCAAGLPGIYNMKLVPDTWAMAYWCSCAW